MNMQINQIRLAFKRKLIGNKKMTNYVLKVLSVMPKNIIEFVTENVWFVTSFEDAWAFTFTGNDFENRHVVFLSDDLFKQNKDQIYWTITHEIGHVVLGHKNRFLEKFGEEKVRKQEDEADKFARQYTVLL